MKHTNACCDGTGWTGDPKAPCADHYEPSDLFAVFGRDIEAPF